jgi:ribose transport system substrate-binding protein
MKHLITASALALFASAAYAQDTKVIGVSIPAATHGWAGGMNFWAQSAVDRLEATYPQLDFVLQTAGDPAEQVADIEDMMATRKLDGLVVLPFESEPLTGPVKAVRDAGVWVTVFDRGLSEPGIENLLVQGDNPGFGALSGKYFKDKMPNGGKIVVLRGIPTTIDNERVDNFMAAIEGTGIEVLAAEHGNWNRDDSFEVMSDYLAKFPQIDAVWASDDDMAIGALAAIDAAGRSGMWVLGGAGMQEMIKKVQANDPVVVADVTYPPSMMATAIELTALHFVQGGPTSGKYVIGAELITPENAANYIVPDSPF